MMGKFWIEREVTQSLVRGLGLPTWLGREDV